MISSEISFASLNDSGPDPKASVFPLTDWTLDQAHNYVLSFEFGNTVLQ